MAVAEYLENHAKVSQVRYPGLKNDPGHTVAARQMNNGFGGVLAFDVGETQDDAKNFISALSIIYHAVSLGATESLICIPYLTTMLYMPPERRTDFGVNLNTVRLSVGIEPIGQILDDIEQALSVV
jgi:cystathionine beta-lyase/cystathionine gamma-synthase